MGLSGPWRRGLSSGAVGALGTIMVMIPLYDIWDDVVAGKSVVSTLVENAIPLGFALALVVASVWIYYQDWEDHYVAHLTKVTVLGALGFTFIYGWVLGIQFYLQHDLKPLIITLDAVLIGTLSMFALGVYDTKRRRNREALERERDRLGALFENTADHIATMTVTADGIAVEETNPGFETTFENPKRVLEETLEALDDVDDFGTFVSHVEVGRSYETEFTTRTTSGPRDFLVRLVPFEMNEGADVFVVLTDITEQQRLAREVEAKNRIEYLHTVASQMANATDAEEAYQLTMDAIDQSLTHDSAGIVVDGELVAARGTDELFAPDRIDKVQSARRPLIEADGGTEVTVEGRTTVLTTGLGGHGAIQITADDEFSDSEVKAAELLATHLLETLRRLAREDELREERERMEFLNRVLRHDLLNGMNVVRMQAQILENHVDEEGEERLDTVVQQVDDMADLINTMRSFMKAVVEGAKPELEPVPLDTVLGEEVERARRSYDNAAFEVEGGIFPPVEVHADDLLSELFQNLLTNAVEHNESGQPRVGIATSVDSDEIEIRIADNGPGIPEGMRSRIFEKGEKGETSEGTGLGLYLCKQIVETYGGSLDVTGSDMGGAEFVVRLPRAKENGNGSGNGNGGGL